VVVIGTPSPTSSPRGSKVTTATARPRREIHDPVSVSLSAAARQLEPTGSTTGHQGGSKGAVGGTDEGAILEEPEFILSPGENINFADMAVLVYQFRSPERFAS
jgi:hypothetical protein